jgi:hypothetical protein
MRIAVICLAIALPATAACNPDQVLADDDGVTSGDGGHQGPDANTGNGPCDMTGVWVAEQHTVSSALGADQNTTNWYYYAITQSGDAFTVTDSLNCGFVVDGTTTVTLKDATLEALAGTENAGPNRKGTFKLAGDGQTCDFAFDRTYNLRGANKATYLTDVWNVGDPPKPLSMFPDLPKAPPGMEDWDADGKDGFTLSTGIGDRYAAQRDWNEHSGNVPAHSAEFGGNGVITVLWDSQEGISDQTPVILRTSSTPKGNGWARYARVDDRLTLVTTGDHPKLETCRNVQSLAQQIWP